MYYVTHMTYECSTHSIHSVSGLKNVLNVKLKTMIQDIEMTAKYNKTIKEIS